ncbi:hypothetical protein KPL71_024548 [Citrus sinensis]|uniref:Uncharacterized protein n=1 Tax=Citrus sinensis TaxID=2711 RepID=A0ACB8IS57_CITSI|nr:hypothetical protein KPL71_024548 [Citrus sinensis]
MRLYTLRITESTSMTDHINTLKILFSQLTMLCHNIEENERAELQLQSLPDSYDQLIINLMNNNIADSLVFDDVATSVLNEESRRKNKENRQASSQQAEALLVTRGRSMERGPSGSHNHGRSKFRRAIWHMTSRREWFYTYEPISGGFVYIGDDHALEITDIGTIKIKMFNGTIRTIEEARHVKGLKKNLLSLGQIDSHGYKTHEADACVASNGEESTIMWHLKLGHMLEQGLKILSERKLLPRLKSAETTKTACYIGNRLPSTAIRLKTAMEMWTEKPADYSYLHAFGCLVYVMYNAQERAKLYPKSRKCIFLGSDDGVKRRVVSWVSKWQTVVALSTTEAEYMATTQACKEAIWIQRTKHIRVQYYFVREVVEDGNMDLSKIHTKENLADVLTKPINTDKFVWSRSSCGLTET